VFHYLVHNIPVSGGGRDTVEDMAMVVYIAHQFPLAVETCTVYLPKFEPIQAILVRLHILQIYSASRSGQH